MRHCIALVGALALFSCNKSLSWSLNGGGGSSGGSSPSTASSGGGGGGGGGGNSPASGPSEAGAAPAGAPMKPACALTEAKLAIGKDYQQDDVILGDFNGDGKLDAAFSEMRGRSDTRYPKPSADLRVFLGDGKGGFGQAIITALPLTEEWNPDGIAGDFDGDGKVDIFLADGTNPSHGPVGSIVLLGKGNGTFGKPIVASGDSVYGFFNLQVADIDGDKRADVVAAAEIEGKGAGIVVLHGKAGGLGKPIAFEGKKGLSYELAYRDKFQWRVGDMDGTGTSSFVVAPNGLAAIDFDRDSGAGNYGVCALQLTKKHGLDGAQCAESDTKLEAETVALADFNGDGHLDIVSGPEQHSYMDSVHHIDVVLNTAKGKLEPKRRKIAADMAPLNAFWAIDAGDVTGDGKADIVAVGSKSGGSDTIALVVTGKGDGSFPTSFIATTNYQANGNAAVVRFGAFQGPGTLGFAISAWEGPESYIHVYSGKCAR